MRKTLIIGLDGATWDIIKPLAVEGKLPTFKKLMEEGVWGDLESTIPPITNPAWFSLATGMNPGKLGMFDFLSRKDSTYNLHPSSSHDLQGKAIWDYVSAAGDGNKKVGIVNYPMLFPPYEINGFMISGLGSSEKENITFPKSLKERIDDIANTYEITVNHQDKKYDDEDLYLKDLYRVLEKRTKVICHLMREEDWDLFISIFSCTDWTQHLMWKHIDKSHPLYDPEESEKYKQEFIKFWIKIDDVVCNMIKIAGENTNLFIVSDHGFGPQDECFNLAKWLEGKGYLVRKKKEKTIIIKEKMSSISNMVAKTPFRKIIPHTIAKVVSSASKIRITDEIDFKKSRAYVLGHTIPFGGIYLNVKGRDLRGCINNGSEYDALKRDIIRELEDLRKDVGQDVEVSIFDPNEIYKGDKVKLAPDIIFTIDNWRCIINEENFDDVFFKNEPYSNRHTGSHRMNGIFAAYGPDIRKGVGIINAKIYDIAPTILHMFGIPIPRDMDGRVLKEIFKDDSKLAGREVKYQEIKGKNILKERIKELKKVGRI
jgi:predicted AlkP superfamily phosphohydrolase/phosphomutase